VSVNARFPTMNADTILYTAVAVALAARVGNAALALAAL